MKHEPMTQNRPAPLSFGKKVKYLLLELERKQRWLADILGTNPQTLSGYINRGSQMAYGDLLSLAGALRVLPEYLMDEKIALDRRIVPYRGNDTEPVPDAQEVANTVLGRYDPRCNIDPRCFSPSAYAVRASGVHFCSDFGFGHSLGFSVSGFRSNLLLRYS